MKVTQAMAPMMRRMKITRTKMPMPDIVEGWLLVWDGALEVVNFVCRVLGVKLLPGV